MATVYFDAEVFRGMFPAYANCGLYPAASIQVQWDLATNYITDNTMIACYEGMKGSQQVAALNLMTAHLMYLNGLVAAGQPAGLVQSATIDKVSVQLTPPPQSSQWQWWLNQTPYGQQLLALLQVASAGGRFFTSGTAVVPAFRRRWR
jgi:hypothetical protein